MFSQEILNFKEIPQEIDNPAAQQTKSVWKISKERLFNCSSEFIPHLF
jgi:hypothetical protein